MRVCPTPNVVGANAPIATDGVNRKERNQVYLAAVEDVGAALLAVGLIAHHRLDSLNLTKNLCLLAPGASSGILLEHDGGAGTEIVTRRSGNCNLTADGENARKPIASFYLTRSQLDRSHPVA